MSEDGVKVADAAVPEDKSRSAQDYADAVALIADIAAIAVGAVPGLGQVAAVGKAVAVLPKAAEVFKKAAPVLDTMADSPALEKMKGRVPGAAKAALGKVAEAKDAAGESIKAKKAEAEAAKARKEARRVIVEAAEAISVEDFKKRHSTYRSLSEGDGMGYLAYPGCYVFVLLGRGLKKDLADYREVYVGSSDTDLGSAISADLDGRGNVDVYADAKYGQNLYVLPYPCSSEKVSALKDSLVVALDANVSYNARG